MISALTSYSDLPELVLEPCDACGGEGYRLEVDEAATYGEHAEPCAVCDGSGEVEVCSCCGEVPQLVDGRETCSCITVPLKRAA